MSQGAEASTDSSGMVLLCTHGGIIEDILRDDFGATKGLSRGQPLIRLVEPRNVGKVLHFMVALTREESVLDWEINASLEGDVTTLHFGGFRLEKHLLVFAAGSRKGLLDLLDQLAQDHGETMARCAALERQIEATWSRLELDGMVYDEISRLNNELVTLQRELARKNAELERLNDLKNQFLGMAAHDLRSPLGNILTYSELLLEDVMPLSEDHKEFLSIIHASSQYMIRMVDDLLDLARIESGRLDLQLEPTDLRSLLEEHVARIRALAVRKNMHLTMDGLKGLPSVLADPERIRQVLDNLIGNAIKYSPAGSTIEVTGFRRDDFVVIRVRDHGIGIAADHLDRLFKPFGKVWGWGTAGEKSTGLGLAIVKRIVLEHRGEVWVQSVLGKGSDFFFSLPVDTEGVERAL